MVKIDISEMLIGFASKVSVVARKPEVPLKIKNIKREGQSMVTERKRSKVLRDLKEALVEASEAQVQKSSKVEVQIVREAQVP